jgi:hypothetical protein
MYNHITETVRPTFLYMQIILRVADDGSDGTENVEDWIMRKVTYLDFNKQQKLIHEQCIM